MASVAPTTTGSGPDAQASLYRQLRLVANRLRTIGTCESICWALATLGVLFLSLAWMDIIWQLPMTVRRWGVPIAVLTVLCLFVWLLYRRFSSTNKELIARRLDEVGGTGGQILSGLDMITQHHSGKQNQTSLSPLANGIASVAVTQASQRAAGIESSAAAPWSIAKRSALIAGAVALVTALFSVFAPHAFSTSAKRLFAPSVDTPPYTPLQFSVSPGDVTLTYGQPLEVSVEITGGTAEQAHLVVGDPTSVDSVPVSMFPRGSGKWQAVLPRVLESTSYFVTADRGRSETYQIEVLDTPKIESIDYTITPPAYTNLPARKGRHPQDAIAGVSGTEVQLSILASRPLSGGTVRIDQGKGTETESVTLSVSQDDPQSVVGRMTIERSCQWHVSVQGANGVESEWEIPIEVELLIDQPPIARITQPRPRSYATQSTKIPVAVVGEDDFGIARMRLYRIVDGSRPLPVDLPTDGSRVVQGDVMLPLESFGLEAGDKLTLFARVDDTRPERSQGGESPLTEIEIISQSDFNRMVAARQGQQMLENKFKQARRMMEQLATEAAELQKEIDAADPNDKEQQAKLKERMKQLQQKMRDVAEQLEKLAEQELPLEIDKQWNDLLREQAKALREAAVACENVAKEGKSLKEQADELQKQLDKIRQKQDQQITQPMEMLKKIAPLIAAESKFAQLVAQQRAIVDQMNTYRNQEAVRDQADRQRMVELRDEEAAVREALSVLLEEVEASAERLGDDPELQELKQSSLEFVQAVRESPIDTDLKAARSAMSEFNGIDGYAKALSALQEMEKFLKQCQSNGQQASDCLKKKFQPGMPQSDSNSLQQMMNQLGLNPGSQSGYSMRGNSGQNVGLYGNQPFAEPAGGGQGDDGRLAPARGGDRTAMTNSDGALLDQSELPTTSRTSARDVPLRYRQQAETYLRRLAEQLDQ
ncbi:coiled-coil domain-containing protein [Stieleria varia]|uniref:Uncharacterized protein n=1 Tax=Stieleria varia TaxID=2528005 RepID=A0A5C6A7Y7_9BACT|nr:hypothetical protein [Stieleria varia]TWT94413.1 hypothetical protein Pla52n_52340 [Stieleria varia]